MVHQRNQLTHFTIIVPSPPLSSSAGGDKKKSPFTPCGTFTSGNRKSDAVAKIQCLSAVDTDACERTTDGSLLLLRPPFAEPGTGLLQGRQQILPHRAGQARGARRVPPHRHVHHAGENGLFDPSCCFLFFFFFQEDGARGTAGLGTESIIVAEGRAAAPCRGANRAVCLMCSQVCALQHSSPHTAHVIYSGSAAWNAGAEPLIIECLHYPRAPWLDLWY